MALSNKPVHTIILDAGPILNNEPSVSVLVAKCENLITLPSVIDEIRDENARSRLETTLRPFLTIRTPRPESVKFVTDFSRRSGDLPVLSRPDVQILALAYELECERNGGDWRLKKYPGQKGINGSPPKVQRESTDDEVVANQSTQGAQTLSEPQSLTFPEEAPVTGGDTASNWLVESTVAEKRDEVSENLQALQIQASNTDEPGNPELPQQSGDLPEPEPAIGESESSDSEGWITPSNLKRQQAKDQNASTIPISDDQIMQVATITIDFAMQNVLLQIGLNLLSPSIQRVRNIKTFILRCHACFEKVKDMNKQFCPRCGKPTLTRVSCSTNQKGEFKIHLKKKTQWNHRGDRYSIPKPVSGSASGKVGHGKGGGRGGWGQELILAEDQKEYQRAVNGRGKKKETDLMDEDYLPGILTGERRRTGGRPKIGAGRNVNSTKRVA